MNLFKRKKREKVEVNLWELIPIRKFDFEKSENELVTILIPKFTNKFLVQYLMPRLKYPFIKIKLDEIGSAVWLEIDGKKKVGDIAEILEQKFGEKIQPIEERLSKFFTQLKLHHFIDFIKEEK
ncbi:MAG: PqqD family protein [Ignavibacteria bacterium]